MARQAGVVFAGSGLLCGILFLQIRFVSSYTLVLHKISSLEAYRAVYKALHGTLLD